MRVLVTGATGLIGGAVARRFAAAGHQIVALARSDASAARLAELGYTPVHGDLADETSIADAADGVDAVVHAASPGDQHTAANDQAATRAIIAALRGTSKRFLYTSGCLLYGSTGDMPATEDSPLHPVELVRFRQALEGEILNAAADGVHPIVMVHRRPQSHRELDHGLHVRLLKGHHAPDPAGAAACRTCVLRPIRTFGNDAGENRRWQTE